MEIFIKTKTTGNKFYVSFQDEVEIKKSKNKVEILIRK